MERYRCFLPVQRLRGERSTPGLRLFLRLLSPLVESVAVFVRVCVVGFGWMVVRFVRVIRLPACARVSRVNVNTTDATTGATALLLPAQKTVCPVSHTKAGPARGRFKRATCPW